MEYTDAGNKNKMKILIIETRTKLPALSEEMEQKLPLSVEGSGGMTLNVCAIAGTQAEALQFLAPV